MNSKKILIAEISAILFVLLIITVRTVHIAPIGPAGTSIGFSGINGAVAKALGFHKVFYVLTDIAGYIALLLVGVAGLFGLQQLIARKKLFAVDSKILITGVLYVITLLLYFFFEKVAVNFRPVLMEGELVPEASFPSSHTVLSCVVFFSIYTLSKDYIPSGKLLRIIQPVLQGMIAFTMVGRFLSGAHWFTDIIGGLLLSVCLVSLYLAALDFPITAYKPKH